jgi:3-hydroxyisobutyrate dehydrogenase-like beta-hydroxyacid dehydrogenase
MSLDLGKLASDGLTILESVIEAAPGADVVTIAVKDAAALKDILAQIAANAPAIDAPSLDPGDRAEVDAEIESQTSKS